jgi:hypothetical protein
MIYEKDLKLQCYTVKVSSQEILQNIPVNILSEIKEKDEHPYFRAYSVMHEGTARPKIIGENESLPTVWTRKIVRSAKNVIKRGVQFFIGHNKDNSTKGRKSIGEVVGNFQKMIGDKLHNIAVGYFPDKLEADKFNICSIEGGVLAKDYDDYSEIKEVKNVSGIALGHDSYEKPAFPGAVYLASIQAFDDDDPEDSPPSKKNKTGGNPTMTFEDVKKAVRDMNIHVSQLYTEDEVKNDRVFVKLFDNVAKAAKEGMISKEDYDKEVNTKDDTIKKLTKDNQLITAHDKLKKSLPEGLTDSQKNFIDKKFKPEDMESLEESNIKDFVNNAIKEYSEYASLFNADPKDSENTSDDNDSDEKNLDEVDKIVDEVITQPKGV